MAMSASTTIVNSTGVKIKFTNISQVNDDATWAIQPGVGTLIDNGSSCLISMGNSSVIFAPKGVGFDATFVDQNLNIGRIYLDDPAVGAHHFQTGGDFKFDIQNPSGNNYTVTIQAN